MSARDWVIWGGVTVLLMVVSWAAGRWLGTDPADDDDGDYERGYADGLDWAIEEAQSRLDPPPDRVYLPRTGAADWAYQLDWREQTAHDLAPAVLEAENVPEPGHGAQGELAIGVVTPDETAGLGHLSPYGGPNLTAAQRRRDKHKQRGQYAPGPDELEEGWTGALEAIRCDGQTAWFTRMTEAAA